MSGLLLTRPLQDSLALAKKIKGHEIYLQPLLCVQERQDFLNNAYLNKQAALIFTSKHAVEIWSKNNPPNNQKVFCVGEVTAQMCRDVGYRKIYAAHNNARSLLELIAKEPPQPYIFPSGADVTIDFEEMLGREICQRVIVYETKQVSMLRPTILRALAKGRINKVALFSNKTALTFRQLLKGNYNFDLFAMNENIFDIFPGQKRHLIQNEDELIFLL